MSNARRDHHARRANIISSNLVLACGKRRSAKHSSMLLLADSKHTRVMIDGGVAELLATMSFLHPQTGALRMLKYIEQTVLFSTKHNSSARKIRLSNRVSVSA